jgi:hypothetical protein
LEECKSEEEEFIECIEEDENGNKVINRKRKRSKDKEGGSKNY